MRQHRRGYRFSVDAVLLAHGAARRPAARVLDLGTGCGIVPLLLAARRPGARIWGVEIQDALARLAAENVRENGLEDRIEIRNMDMREIDRGLTGGSVDLAVANPPYRPAGSGRRCPDGERDVARHEIRIDLAGVIAAARRMLDPGGRFLIVYPAERSAELLDRMRGAGIEPKRFRPVYSRAGEPARLVLVEGRRGGNAGLRLEAPLFVREPDGAYSAETAAMFRLGASAGEDRDGSVPVFPPESRTRAGPRARPDGPSRSPYP